MRVTFGEGNLEIEQWSSFEDLSRRLRHCNLGIIQLGNKDEESAAFSSVILHSSSTGHSFGVGVSARDGALSPHVFPMAEKQMIFFGYDNQVAAVSVASKSVVLQTKLDGLFYNFVPRADRDFILVFCEVGAYALNLECEILWKHNYDVMVGWSLREDILRLDFIDAHSIEIHVPTGRVSPATN